MKKIISAIIIIAMVISTLSMVVFAGDLQGSATPNEAQFGGATIIATDREHRCSAPSQDIAAAIQEGGLCNYYVSGYVRLLETPNKPVAVGIGCEIKNSATIKWPQTAKITINDTEWHKITGKWKIEIEDVTSAKTFAEVLYSGMSGDAGAYLGDMEWDAITICRMYDDGSYGENILVNEDMNVDTNGNIKGWTKNQRLTMTSSVKIPEQEGGTLLVEDRSSNSSGPSQNVYEALSSNGGEKYYYSAYFRLVDVPEETINCSIGIEFLKNKASFAWKGPNTVAVSDDNWHKISGVITMPDSEFDNAVTYINTAKTDKTAYMGDIEFDAVFLAKQDENGLYGNNLIKNPTMECDAEGATADWGCYRVATITNTGYAPDIIEGGVENPDGSVSYPSGNVPTDDKNIVYSGRFYDKETSKQAAFESYVEIKFTGKQISAMAGSSGNVYYELDGVLNYDVINLSTLRLRNLTDGTHTLRIYANAQQSCFTLSGFVIDKDGKTLPITQVKKIEFIGDSITEGYVAPSDKAENIANNSYLNSYALKAGRKLNAEFGWSFNTVAFGGIGLVRVDNGDPLTMGERYFLQREYIKSTDGTTRESVLQAVDAYDYNYVPDYIVINLGTNDGTLSSSDFLQNYVKFITDLKEAYPNVVIFCMTPFNGAKEHYIKETVAEFDKDVYVINSAQWGIEQGADVHPAPASLDKAAEKLFAILSEYNEKGTLPKSEAINAKEISITSDVQYAFAYFRSTGLGITADMADENGYIERSYTVYNVGKYDAKMRVLWQNDWTDLKDSSAISTKTVKVGTKQQFTIKVKVDENGQVQNNNGEMVDLNTLSLRIEFSNSFSSGSIVYEGTRCIIVPDDLNDFAIAEMNQGSVYKDKEKGKGTCAYHCPDAFPADSISGATLDIGTSLTVNYYARLWDNLNATLKVTRNGKTVELTGAFDSATGYYIYQYKGVNPQCMTDNISAELIAGGKVIDSKAEYSVKEYANNLASKTARELELTEDKYNKLITLLSDMLVYGKNSQDYMKYNLEKLATDGITWLKASEFVTPANIVKNTIKNDANNKITGAGVRVENVNKIYFTVNLTDANAEVYVDGEKAEVIDNKVYTKDIKATGFDNVHTAEIRLGGEVISKVEYNVNAYINNKNADATIGALVKALSNYGVSAVEYGK